VLHFKSLLMAQSGHAHTLNRCPLLGEERKLVGRPVTINLTQIKGFTEVLCSISGGTFSNVATWEHSDGSRSYH
jgi:hypothetical protein